MSKYPATDSVAIRKALDGMSKKKRLAYWCNRLQIIEMREDQGIPCKREKARVLQRIVENGGNNND